MKKFLCALLAGFMCIGMAACAPMSVEKAEEKMQKAGYSVLAYTNDEAEGCVGSFLAQKGLIGGSTLYACLFESKDAATDFYSTASQISTSAVLDGKWVYWGDEAAIKEFTKLF